jgi:hypothetical protein
MKRSSRVSFVSQCTTSLSECAVTGSMFGGAFMSCSWAVTGIDGTGYVVSPLDGVNGVRRNLLARIGLSVGCPVSGARHNRTDLPAISNAGFAFGTGPASYHARSLQFQHLLGGF